ncbi:hypothetical protein Dimus_035864, partial [Dionaea muscipula]
QTPTASTVKSEAKASLRNTNHPQRREKGPPVTVTATRPVTGKERGQISEPQTVVAGEQQTGGGILEEARVRRRNGRPSRESGKRNSNPEVN